MYTYRVKDEIRGMFGELLKTIPGYTQLITEYASNVVLEEDKLHMLSELSVENLRRQFMRSRESMIE